MPIETQEQKCVGCLTCELVCSLRFEKAFNPLKAAIKVKRASIGNRIFETRIYFTEKCDECGLCVKSCPYGVLAKTNQTVRS